jgi:hypothetical protein
MQGKDEKIQDGQNGMLKTGEKIRQRRTVLMNSQHVRFRNENSELARP